MINFAPRNNNYRRDSTRLENLNQEKNTQLENKNKIPGFGERLREAFSGAKNTEIADIIGVRKSAITNYINDRVPEPEQLLKIAKYTSCSLHWLLTGEGPKFLSEELNQQSSKFAKNTQTDEKQNFQNEIDKLKKRLTKLESDFYRADVKNNSKNTFNKIEGNPSAGDKRREPTMAEIEEEYGIPRSTTARIVADLDLKGITIREMWIVYRAFGLDTSKLPAEYEDDELFIKDNDQQLIENPNNNISKKSNGH